MIGTLWLCPKVHVVVACLLGSPACLLACFFAFSLAKTTGKACPAGDHASHTAAGGLAGGLAVGHYVVSCPGAPDYMLAKQWHHCSSLFIRPFHCSPALLFSVEHAAPHACRTSYKFQPTQSKRNAQLIRAKDARAPQQKLQNQQQHGRSLLSLASSCPMRLPSEKAPFEKLEQMEHL
ncbi:uncharacterized protein B0I36DRAFT_338298 [Microdochium trichocladiopsis]|uniref:Secreted protein n=1 Tax=Microdochium trichocladiopsis TaxID=1682393 RepID=A0A9P9BFZ4_9PEZI|nr:uncharacterized protein B0I36DRAFT_338298 [Microdochium trichocladiopsis]KAH7014129.1 hypothetical protein B0I36DRAFT_338298 [Microdochium trichocladiopsis]